MSNNDAAEIQATLKNIGVTAVPEQIVNKLKTLARFKVTGAEAKRNATRSLARAAGVDPSALYKGSSTTVHVADVKEDGKSYEIKSAVTNLYNEKFQIKLNRKPFLQQKSFISL